MGGPYLRPLSLARRAMVDPIAQIAEWRVANLRFFHDLGPQDHAKLAGWPDVIRAHRRLRRMVCAVQVIPHERTALEPGGLLAGRPDYRFAVAGRALSVEETRPASTCPNSI